MADQHSHSGSYGLLATQPDVQCLVCTRPFNLDTEIADSFEALAICRECKMTVLTGSYRDDTTRTNRQRQRQRPFTSHEPMEDAFSQQFSQLIDLARQGHEADVDSPTVPRQRTSYISTPNRSQRWHSSDDESDGLNYADSVFGEIESNISFDDDDGESNASIEHQTTMGREIVIQLDSGSYVNTDIDIDPMNAGVDHWDSDDPEDEHSEDSDLDEAGDTMQAHRQQWHDIAPSGLNEQESEDTVWTWRTARSQGVNRTNLRADMEGREIRRTFIGNPGDYVDARQFEMVLEQFAEDNNTTRGAPPASASSIENLPSVVISTSGDINGGVTCPVCKDDMPIGTVAKQLPCMHLYHSSCIIPWLSSRNTCPVCRYELPTDDTEYERSKRATANEGGIYVVEHTHPHETAEETSYEPDVEGNSNTVGGTMEETNTREDSVYSAQQPNGARGHHRWLFIAAAPVVTLVYLYDILWLRLEKIRNKLRRQGINGPKPTFLYGNTQEMKRIRQELKCVQRQRKDTNMNSYISIIFPHFIHGRKTYVLKSSPGMIGLIVDATVPLLQAWENILDGAGGSKEIYVDGYLRNFSADVIARACFGSSFTKGEDIFCKLRQLQKAISQQETFVGLSALWKYLPTKSNREIRKLNQEVRLLILDLCKEHRSRSHGNDVTHMSTQNNLLHAIINGADRRPSYFSGTEDFIVDNCKNIYFAGHKTAAVTATWCLMLLAAHPDWQITMVIQENLRLYPPASLIMREALTDVSLGGVDVPRGTIIQVAISMLQLDKDAWGPDADEFRPDRFANGAAAACKPAHMYMPFGYGPRLCTGQNLAMAELKLLLAHLLTRFSFSISPGYQHMPSYRLTIEPGFGMPLIVTKLTLSSSLFLCLMEELPALTIALLILSLVLSYLLHQICLRSENIRKNLKRQGIKGPEPTVLYGNTREMKRIQQDLKIVQTQDANNYSLTVFPHLLLWRETYGPVFIYSTGALEILHVSDPEMVKDIGHCTPSELGKPTYLKRSRKALFGGGLLTVNGDEWAYQRKLMAPEFFMDKIKGMIELIEDATSPLLESWESMLDNVGGSREIVVDDYLRKLSADVIARICFGSSFTRGEEIFCKIRQLQKALSQQDALVGISAFWKYLPTRANREIKELDEEVRLLILSVMKEHNNNRT
ncbi:hypothetical protein HU200_064543 [Digitaria exilis]|uniref:RING-type E3 ubiquitin transferase n=1 Tax=Digitaria exilis TaxID=1010633 RepID=A0A834ZZM9_9POAL|nr:hypothetical protein HU200_064543 [Digitaria exilis]